jgi:hypothetical protein
MLLLLHSAASDPGIEQITPIWVGRRWRTIWQVPTASILFILLCGLGR